MRVKLKSEVESKYSQEDLDEAFPNVDPGIKPFGSRVLVQIRSPRAKTKGGLILTEDVKEIELWSTQTGMVRAVGPVAFRNRETLATFPEGEWVKEGMFVRIPKYNQDKWWVEYEIETTKGVVVTNRALFMLINDLDILGEKTGNPLALKAFVA